MSATRDLIAAALTVRDVIQRGSVPEVYAAVKDLRELCARAMTAQQRTSDADMQVYQAIADGYTRDTQPISAAEVPMPEPSHESVVLENGMYRINSRMYDEDKMRTYGNAREAAVWAKVAKALNLGTGVRFAESYLLAQIAECAALEGDLLLAHQAGEAAGYARGLEAARDYAVMRWKAEVDLRPLENKHRRTMDDVWRQVISHTGGDPVALIGPCHDALVALREEVRP